MVIAENIAATKDDRAIEGAQCRRELDICCVSIVTGIQAKTIGASGKSAKPQSSPFQDIAEQKLGATKMRI
jgi:hypothetical protein